jgi:hypothetical protein
LEKEFIKSLKNLDFDMKKVNWKVWGGVLAAVLIVAVLAYYKPWMSEEEKKAAEAKKLAEAKAKEVEAAKNASKNTLVKTPVGYAVQSN